MDTYAESRYVCCALLAAWQPGKNFIRVSVVATITLLTPLLLNTVDGFR
jgi:hypothetical protein